jgi:hypothetical protein
LLNAQVNIRHRSYLSAVLKEDLGHVRSRTTRTLMSDTRPLGYQVREMTLC